MHKTYLYNPPSPNNSMSRRSVIKHGPSTHVISLPASWVRKNNIQKGEELQVTQNGRELIVSTQIQAAPLTTTQDVSNLTPFLVTRLLARNYQKGYDEIKLTHENPEILAAIKEKTQDLMGLEIIEQNEHTCTIQSVTRNLDIDFDNSLRKVFLIVKQMIESCQQAYQAGDEKALRNIKLRDMEVNRFAYFCLRQINKERHVNIEQRHQSFVLYHLVETLEDLGDTIVLFAKELAQAPPNKILTEILTELKKQYETSYDYFYTPTAKRAKKALEHNLRIHELIEEIVESKLSKHEKLASIQAHHATELIYPFTTMRLDLIQQEA